MQILTSMVPSFREIRDIGNDGLSLDKKEVDPELSTYLVVHPDNQGFASTMPNVQYHAQIKVRHK